MGRYCAPGFAPASTAGAGAAVESVIDAQPPV